MRSVDGGANGVRYPLHADSRWRAYPPRPQIVDGIVVWTYADGVGGGVYAVTPPGSFVSEPADNGFVGPDNFFKRDRAGA